MKPFSGGSIALAATLATLMSIRGYRRKSLSRSGAVTAFAVGFLSISCGLRGFLLLFFYIIGTKATKYKKEIKARLDMTALESSVRGPSQVLACSVLAVVCSLLHAFYFGQEKSIDFNANPIESTLACAILSHYSTCLADTLASELGLLSTKQPVLVTRPWHRVPAGTNGGITFLGLVFSSLGGFLMAFSSLCLDFLGGLDCYHLFVLIFCTTCGLVGSLVDSILGAVFQVTYFDEDLKRVSSRGSQRICGFDILSNAQVNLVSVAFMTVFGGFVLGPKLFDILVE